MTRAREQGNAFVLRVALSALLVFIAGLFVLSDDDQRVDKLQKGDSRNQAIGTGDSNYSSTGTSQDPPVSDEELYHLNTPVLSASSNRATQSDHPKPGVNAPSSITYRYETRLARESETDVSSSVAIRAIGADSSASLISRTLSVVVQNDTGGCKSCSRSVPRHLTIPKGCNYTSHVLTQLHREPNVPIEQTYDLFTEYRLVPNLDAVGRPEGFLLTLWVRNKGLADVHPSISMKLTVTMDCVDDDSTK